MSTSPASLYETFYGEDSVYTRDNVVSIGEEISARIAQAGYENGVRTRVNSVSSQDIIKGGALVSVYATQLQSKT